MGKWEMVRLGDVFNLQMGKTPSRDNAAYWNDGSYKWVSIADIGQSNKYISDTKETITQYAIQETGIKLVPKNTVIMSFKLSLGKTAITSQDMYTNEAIMAFHNKGMYSADIDYLYHLFRWFPWGLNTNKAVMGATLNKATLSNIKIPLPPLDEQQRIAQNLDLASEIVKGYNEQLAELDKLVQSVFYEMFGDPVDNLMKWNKVSLGEACIKITDGKHGGCNFEEASGYYFVGAREIRNGQICYDTAPQITKEHFEESYRRCNLEKGDLVLVNTGATIGKSAIARSDLSEKTLLQKSVALFKTDINVLLPVFLQCCYTLNSEMYRVKNASAQPNLLLSKIKETKIILPPLPLQIRFASIVTEIEAHKEQVKQALTEAENLFNSLMQEYFE